MHGDGRRLIRSHHPSLGATDGPPPPAVGRRHTNLVSSVALSADGRVVASDSHDVAVLRLWDATTGKGQIILLPLNGTAGCRLGLVARRSIVAATSRDWHRFVGRGDESAQTHAGRWPKSSQVAGVFTGRTDFGCWPPQPKGASVGDGERPDLRRISGHQVAIQTEAFSSDGRRLVSCDQGGTAFVWDVTGRHGRPAERLSKAELERLWKCLAADDARRGPPRRRVEVERRSVRGDPVGRSCAFRGEHEDARIAQWITELDDDRFTMHKRGRTGPRRRCRRIGSARAVAKTPSPEATRRRIMDLLRLVDGDVHSPERLRGSRRGSVRRWNTPALRLRGSSRRDQSRRQVLAIRLTREAKVALACMMADQRLKARNDKPAAEKKQLP